MSANILSSFLAVILLFLGGETSLLDWVETAGFWASEGLTDSPETYRRELQTAVPAELPDHHNLIRRLGADSFAEREAATRDLRKAGAAAEPALRLAAQDSDPEIAMRANELLKEQTPVNEPSPLRRLMAVHGLADLADKADETLLETFAKDSDLSVAREAQRGLAKIRGEPAENKTSRYTARKLLPADTASLLEFRPSPPQAAAGLEKRPVTHPLQRETLEIIKRFGNVRIDRLTVAASRVLNRQEGWILMVAEGAYDPERLEERVLATRGGLKEVRKEVSFLRVSKKSVLFPLNSSVLVMLFGPVPDSLPIDSLVAALKEPANPSRLPEALQGIVTEMPAEAEMAVYVSSPADLPNANADLKALSQLHMIGTRKDGHLLLQAFGTGTDADALQKIAETRTQQLQGIRPMIAQAGEIDGQSLIRILDSVHITSEKNELRLELTLPSNLLEVLAPLFGGRSVLGNPEADFEDMNMPEHMPQEF